MFSLSEKTGSNKKEQTSRRVFTLRRAFMRIRPYVSTFGRYRLSAEIQQHRARTDDVAVWGRDQYWYFPTV